MTKRYCADSAVQTAIAEVLGFYGLEPNPAAASRKPAVASTIGEQFQRLVVAENVVAEVRRRVPIGGDDRRLIFRLVDSARQGVEEADRLALGSKYAGARDSCVIAFANAGGGAVGSFETFRRTWVSSAELLETTARQDVPSGPMRNPSRPTGPNAPASMPAKANPVRTGAIRSSRWNGKASVSK